MIYLFLLTTIFLASGFPVAFSLGGAALLAAGIGQLTGQFDAAFLAALPERLFGIMTNESLVAVPLFVLMGNLLERTKISEGLLTSMSKLFCGMRGGLGVSVCVVGALLAASTGIVGATVVTMGLISLPAMLKKNYSPELSTGVICASGTLGQIIPPSIVLIILGDVMGSAHQQAQLSLGNWSPSSVSVADLFLGALVPGLILVGLYILYILVIAHLKPDQAPADTSEDRNFLELITSKDLLSSLLPALFLILGVLGSILLGIATPTEAAAVGVVGALIIAKMQKSLSLDLMMESSKSSVKITSMVFMILIGASVFSAVFRGYQGDEIVQEFLLGLHGDPAVIFWTVMIFIFLLGFFIDFFEIVFVVVPIVGPVLLQMDFDPIWLGVMIAMNLQTSFLTPPFGFSLFYLRGVAPPELKTASLYRGVIPFIGIQVLVLILLFMFPELIYSPLREVAQ